MSIDKNSKPLLYFAAPLFNDAELEFNERLCSQLAPWFEIYLPQRDGGLLVDLLDKGVAVNAAYRTIFDRDLEAIRECSVLLILLDGRVVDEGAAFELGVGYTFGKLCVGLQTDARRLLPSGNNPMIESALSRVFSTVLELKIWANQLRMVEGNSAIETR